MEHIRKLLSGFWSDFLFSVSDDELSEFSRHIEPDVIKKSFSMHLISALLQFFNIIVLFVLHKTNDLVMSSTDKFFLIVTITAFLISAIMLIYLKRIQYTDNRN